MTEQMQQKTEHGSSIYAPEHIEAPRTRIHLLRDSGAPRRARLSDDPALNELAFYGRIASPDDWEPGSEVPTADLSVRMFGGGL